MKNNAEPRRSVKTALSWSLKTIGIGEKVHTPDRKTGATPAVAGRVWEQVQKDSHA